MTIERHQGSSFEDRLESLLKADPWRMEILRAVSCLGLPQHAVGAGFVRAAVWDHLHGYKARTALPDIDVLFFDPDNLGREREEGAEKRLGRQMPAVPWQVRNQARMHLRNADSPYANLEEALERWLETATAVAVRLEPDGRLAIIAPFGLEDLFAPASRPTAAGRHRWDTYLQRMREKNWPAHWPKVTVEGLGLSI